MVEVDERLEAILAELLINNAANYGFGLTFRKRTKQSVQVAPVLVSQLFSANCEALVCPRVPFVVLAKGKEGRQLTS